MNRYMKVLEQSAPKVYKWDFVLGRLLATQDVRYVGAHQLTTVNFKKLREFVKKEGLPIKTNDDNDAIEIDEEAFGTERIRAYLQEARKTVFHKLWHFPSKNGDIFIELGGPYGLLKKTLRNILKTTKNRFYNFGQWNLLKFTPAWIKVSNEFIVKEPIPVLEPRSRRQTMELVFYETIENVPVTTNIVVSRTCPLAIEKEIIPMIRALQDIDGFGPAKRGFISETKDFKKI